LRAKRRLTRGVATERVQPLRAFPGKNCRAYVSAIAIRALPRSCKVPAAGAAGRRLPEEHGRLFITAGGRTGPNPVENSFFCLNCCRSATHHQTPQPARGKSRVVARRFDCFPRRLFIVWSLIVPGPVPVSGFNASRSGPFLTGPPKNESHRRRQKTRADDFTRPAGRVGRPQFLQNIRANQRLGIRRGVRRAGFAQGVGRAVHKSGGVLRRRGPSRQPEFTAQSPVAPGALSRTSGCFSRKIRAAGPRPTSRRATRAGAQFANARNHQRCCTGSRLAGRGAGCF